MDTQKSYIPALRFHWLTPLYDPLISRFMREDILRERLVLEADILPGMRVLDLGCGTATLSIMIKQSHVLSRVYGLDVDPQVLEIAHGKVDQASALVTLEQGKADQLPFADGWFDRVVSSLMLHHLDTQQKQQALNEVYRILRPGGKFAILDIGIPHGIYARMVSQIMQSMEHAGDNIRGLLPHMLEQAGFVCITEGESIASLFGSLSLLCAEKPTA